MPHGLRSAAAVSSLVDGSVEKARGLQPGFPASGAQMGGGGQLGDVRWRLMMTPQVGGHEETGLDTGSDLRKKDRHSLHHHGVSRRRFQGVTLAGHEQVRSQT